MTASERLPIYIIIQLLKGGRWKAHDFRVLESHD